MTYEQLCDKIRSGEVFSFSRWGDGELACMFQTRPGKANCDGHQYFPDLGQRLLEIAKSKPPYYMALQRLGYSQHTQAVDALGIEWCKADIMHHASKREGLATLFDAIKSSKRRVLIVGPAHLSELGAFKFDLIEIPSRNCWLDYDRVLKKLDKMLNPTDIVVFAASMMTNVLIHDLHGEATLIDVGSVLDPYCGVISRTYMKEL